MCVGVVDAQSNQSKNYESGNTICFLGDSITHGGQFHEFLQLFYATRNPEMRLRFINCGISGDDAKGMIYRFEKDVSLHNPTHMFLMTGMNDVIKTLYFEGEAPNEIIKKRNQALSNYKINMGILAEKINQSKITPIYLTPTIYDQYSKIEYENNMGCNDALIACTKHIKKIANQYDAKLVDLNTKMKNLMDFGLQKDSLFTIIGKDRVHPGTTGHFIMFYEIISAIESPNVVAQISINLQQNNLIQTKNCSVYNLEVSDKSISFNCMENSLPYPVDASLEKAISLVSFEKDFNKEVLQVKGIKDGQYDLFIQGELINTFSKKELNQSINLSNQFNTPQYKQALQIKKLCKEYRKTGYQLRIIPFIEFKYLNDYIGSNSVLSKKIHLKKRLKTIEGEPFYNYIKDSFDAYFEVLPKQDSLIKRLKLIENLIYKKNKPKNLEWKLVKRK